MCIERTQESAFLQVSPREAVFLALEQTHAKHESQCLIRFIVHTYTKQKEMAVHLPRGRKQMIIREKEFDMMENSLNCAPNDRNKGCRFQSRRDTRRCARTTTHKRQDRGVKIS